MRARHSIKYEEQNYKENVDRAREGAQIASSILADFSREKALSSANQKRLEKLEKLFRKVRSEAGGSDAPAEVKDPPSELNDALERLSKSSEQLRERVENTPRQVISASIIDCANEVVELVRQIRQMTRR